MKIAEEELLKKENITLETSAKTFNDIVNNIKLLKENIEKEINKINILYEEVNSNLTKSYKEKHEKLTKEENELREKLQIEVTKTKEKLEYFFSESNNQLILNERINSGLKNFEKEKEKNNLRILSYISQMNKNNKNMTKLLKEIIKGIKFYYNENENNIKYEEYIFNGLPIPNNIQFKSITSNSFDLSWNIDSNYIINQKINYRVEMKEENEENFKEIYKGTEQNYKINNLKPNNFYIIRICCILNEYAGQWSVNKKIKIKIINKDLDNSKIIKNEDEKNKIIEWMSKEGNVTNIKLIYRATEDGDKSEKLIERIKNKGPIISFIQTKKGKKFGGFTKNNWTDESGIKKADPNAFLFSLDNKAKYRILKSNLAFVYFNTNPLCYGNDSDGYGIYLNENFLENKNKEDQYSRVYDVPSDNCLTGETNFEVEEVEIYQINFE